MSVIKQIGVLGAGQMGRGIAQVAAQAGFTVYLADVDKSTATKAADGIHQQLKKLVEKGKMPEATLQQISKSIMPAELVDLKNCDLAIEAVTENPVLKFKIFQQLDEICRKDCLLASNTSSISITKIAAQTRRPEKVAGMHFMNPVPIMKLVEGIRGLQTSDHTFDAIRAVSERMGKTFIEAKDFPGFAVNRILMPMINEAIHALHQGVASKEDIDSAMTLGTNQPMGPLTLADFIGLDTCLSIMEVLHEGLGDPRYAPCPLLKNYVAAGWLGKKTGRGIYNYGLQ